MNVYLIVILAILVADYLASLVVERLNLRCASPELPEEFKGYYDAEKYRLSQNYLRDNTLFQLRAGGAITLLKIIFILAGGFNLVDSATRSFGLGPIWTGLIFTGMLLLLFQFAQVPLSAYHTFVIEEKYGFNRTRVKTFIADLLKGWVLGAVVGGAVLAVVLAIFHALGPWA